MNNLLVAGAANKTEKLRGFFYKFGVDHCAGMNETKTSEDAMKISARNLLKGKVKKITHGTVNSEITVTLPGGIEIVSIITKTSAENMGLATGHDVYAVIKASNVMIATD